MGYGWQHGHRYMWKSGNITKMLHLTSHDLR